MIIGEDLTKSLTALRSELETSSEALSSDLARTLNLHSDDPAFPQVPAVCLQEGEPTPDGAWGSQRRHGGIPPEMSLQNKLPIRVPGDDRGTLSDIISPCQQDTRSHSGPGLHEPAVFQWVMVGLAMDQPLEAIFFPGILDGLTGRLGLMPPGVVDPPTSARAGMSQ